MDSHNAPNPKQHHNLLQTKFYSILLLQQQKVDLLLITKTENEVSKSAAA